MPTSEPADILLGLDELIDSPAWFPNHIDTGNRKISFRYLVEEEYAKSSFLDERLVSDSINVFQANVDDLLDIFKFHTRARTVHHILHGAFCGSTLLSRYLDASSAFFTLREPSILTELALALPYSETIGHSYKQEHSFRDWQMLLGLVLTLASRTYASSKIAVVKANDLCNVIAPHLLRADTRSKIVCVIGSLEEFILSVLKTTQRREWARRRLSQLSVLPPQPHFLTGLDASQLDDANVGAAIWLKYTYIMSQLEKSSFNSRILKVSSSDIIERPESTLNDVFRFYEVPYCESSLEKAARLRLRSRYSKDPSRPYSAHSRRMELSVTRQTCALELDTALQWATEKAADLVQDGGTPLW